MEEKKKTKLYLIISIIAIILLATICIVLTIKYSKEADSGIVKNEDIKISEDDIIKFTKEEIKKKLMYPETAVFSKEKLSFQDNKYIVECYCTSDNRNKQETKVKFVTIVEENNNSLICLDMMTNGDTCTKDAKDIVVELIKNQQYEQIYNEWFCTSMKYIIDDYSKFKNRLEENPINLEKARFEQYDFENKIELHIIEDGVRNGWYFSFSNGQIQNFDILLKYDW